MNVLSDAKTWNAETSTSVLRMQQKVVDDLKPKHKAKVEQLRLAVADVLRPWHNDFYLMKWLKVRKFDVWQAEKVLRANLQWQEEMQMDNVNEVFKPPEVVWKYYPLGSSGQAKNGNLVWIMPVGRLDIRGYVYSAKISDITRYILCSVEYMKRMSQIQSEKIGKLVNSQVLIMDCEGFRIQDHLWKPAPKVFTIFFALLKPFLNEQYRNAMKIFGKDSWKEALLEIIDADQLPKHWGGTRVDEIDGSPYCSSQIGMAGPIPKSYYAGLSRRDYSQNTSLKTTTIEPKKSFIVEFHVSTPESILNWTIGTEEYDIAFGISYSNGDPDSQVEIIPVEKRECQYVPEEGTLICEQAGVYILTLDNSYSWLKSKKVYYDIKVEPPKPEDSQS